MTDCGKMIVVSGPSGAGKSTVLSRVMAADRSIVFSVSATTRKPREGEREGVNYFFTDQAGFCKMIENGELLEYAQYVENHYGTPRTPVEENLKKGLSVLFDIEVQGAMQLKSLCPEAILIFVIPPDFSQIENRLRARGTDSEKKILQRIKTARFEYSMAMNYDYIVINDDPDSAANEIKSIITAEKCRARNRQNYLTEVCSL
ncbi:MAG: guanylate kinase [Oscillospiraceae bacterium]|jgi:guanylate kinase|nr:guanylate kinase [Oscillospiraceae bacterium]